MTKTERGRQTGLVRLVRHAGDEVLSRWQAVLGGDPLGSARELQLDVLSAVAHGTPQDQPRTMRRLASRLGERQPELGELVHQLAALRQVLHAVLSERLEAGLAADAHRRVSAAIDTLVEVCTESTTARLTEAAFVDSLTGLRNRHALDRELRERMALATRGERPLTVVVGDLDGLKTINDRDGHAAGDAALRALGAAIRSALRTGDTAYRIGGDEFLVLLPDTGAEEAETVIARMSRTAPAFGWGAATAPADGTDGSALIELADERLLGCRRNARRTVHPTPHQRSSRKRRDSRRTISAAALVVVGLLSGVGLSFAADGGIGGGHIPPELPAMRGNVTEGPAPTVEGRLVSSDPGTSRPTGPAVDRIQGAKVTEAGSPTTTAGVVAALIAEALEVPDPLLEVLDTEVSLPSLPDPQPVLDVVSEPALPVDPQPVLDLVEDIASKTDESGQKVEGRDSPDKPAREGSPKQR